MILPENTSLSLNNIGVGQPGDEFIVMHQEEMCVPDVYHQSFPPGAIERILCYEAELDPFLTVVEVHDHDDAYERRRERLCAQKRAEQSRIAYLKGLFIYAVTFPFCAATFCRYCWHRSHTTPPNPEGSTFSSRSSVSIFQRSKGSGKDLKLE